MHSGADLEGGGGGRYISLPSGIGPAVSKGPSLYYFEISTFGDGP